MPASAGRSRNGARLVALRCGVIGTEVDGELDVLGHRCARRELLDVRALEGRLRKRLRVHLPLLVPVVDRGGRHVLLRGVLRRVRRDVPGLRELTDRVGGEVRRRGAVVDAHANVRGILRRWTRSRGRTRLRSAAALLAAATLLAAAVAAARGASTGRRGATGRPTCGRRRGSRRRGDARKCLRQHDDPDDGEGGDDHEADRAAGHAARIPMGAGCLAVAAEAASEAFAAAGFPEPAEPANEHRVIRKGLRLVDDAMKQLMITRRGDAEALADRALLLTALLPPRALEFQDVERALVELRTASPGGVPGPIAAHERRLTTSGPTASSMADHGKSPRVLCASATRETPSIVAAVRIGSFFCSASWRTSTYARSMIERSRSFTSSSVQKNAWMSCTHSK